MAITKRKTRILLGLAFAGLLLVIVLAALPLWFPWVLRPVAGNLGAQYESYERKGYGEFGLKNVTVTNEDVRFQAGEVKGLTPPAWISRLRSETGRSTNFVHIRDWELDLTGSAKAASTNAAGKADGSPLQKGTHRSTTNLPGALDKNLAPGGAMLRRAPTPPILLSAIAPAIQPVLAAAPVGEAANTTSAPATNAPVLAVKTSGTYSNLAKLLKTSRQLSRWLPNAVLSNGTVRISEKLEIKLPRVTWSEGKVFAIVNVPQLTNTGVLTADLSAPPPYELSLRFPTVPFSLSNTLVLSASGLDVEGSLQWLGNKAEIQAHFDRTGTLPETAWLTAPNVQVPNSLLEVPLYKDLTGALALQWRTGTFSLDLDARAVPESPAWELPTVDLRLHARGDTNSAVIESLAVNSPMLRVRLSRNLEVSFREPYLREPAALRLAADMDRQPWLPLTGTLEGRTFFWPAEGTYPRAVFEISGTDFGQPDFKAESVALGGEFNWPFLRITNAQAIFEPESRASLSGELNIEDRAVSNGAFRFGGSLAERWFPPGYGYEDVIVEARFHGPITNISHEGTLAVSRVTSPSLKPADIQASWEGEHLSRLRTKLTAEFPEAEISTDASVRMTTSETNLVLHALTLKTNGHAALSLQAPTTISLALSKNSPDWSATVSPLHMSGPNRDLMAQGSVNWPETGQVELQATNLQLTLIEGFVASNLPPAELETLSLAAIWSNGPVSFDLAFLAGATLSNIAVSTRANLTGTPEGLRINELIATADSFELAKASGFLPLTLHPEQTNPVNFAEQQPLQVEITSEPAPTLLRRLTELTDVQIRQVKVGIEVAGTAQSPNAKATVAVEEIEPLWAQTNLPSIRHLELRLQLRDELLSLDHAEVAVDGQRVLANGQIPLGDQYWDSFPSKPLPDWNKASARIRVQEADIAPFAELAPGLITPQGELTIDLKLQPGMKLSGQLAIEGARTRPFPAIGPVRNIDLRIDLADRGLTLTNSSVEIGGAEVYLKGEMTLPGTNFLKAGLPPFALRLTGTNVPLARQPELIIRSDLDLAVVKTNGQPPLISGTANLQNSYFLSDLADLVPGKVAGPERRPPYFSIDTGLLQDWRLAVHVIGTEFMRVRSPLFTGEASANMRLQGTLKDPIAIGDASIDAGRVRFPFGSLQIQQGLVSLTSANPYQPQLSVTAESRKFGYDIRMEVTGTAESPVIQFSSTPPLTSEEILLMLTAGEMPRGNFNFTTQQRAQSLALFLGKDLLSKLGFGDTGEQRLTVTTGEDISEAGKATYDVEYKLTERWSLTGEYDRFGDFNIGAKWRVYSK